MNGKPGDHPITDILTHNIDIYGREGADLVRQIAALCSRDELYAWWSKEIGFRGDGDLVRTKGKVRLNELTERAKKSDWELDR